MDTQGETASIQIDDSTVEKDDSIAYMTADIGHLILEEIRLIRKDMKQEMKSIAERIEILFQSHKRVKSNAIKKAQIKTLKTGILPRPQILDDRAKELKAWGEKLFSKAKLENEKVRKVENQHSSKLHLENSFSATINDTEVFDGRSSLLGEMQPQSKYDSNNANGSLYHEIDPLVCDVDPPFDEDGEINITKRPVINKLFQSQSVKMRSKNPFMETLVGQNLYKCQLCSKRYVNQRDVKRHMRSHTGERPHSCPDCNKSFIRQEHLKVHLRTHTGERPYQCEFCNKAFSRSGDLKVHVRTHTGEKPYQCELCEKGFVKKGDLKRHIKTHANEGPYICPICVKVFAKFSTMNRHMETHLSQADDNGLGKAMPASAVTKDNLESESVDSIFEADTSQMPTLQQVNDEMASTVHEICDNGNDIADTAVTQLDAEKSTV